MEREIARNNRSKIGWKLAMPSHKMRKIKSASLLFKTFDMRFLHHDNFTNDPPGGVT